MELTGLLHVKYDTQTVSEKFAKRDFVIKTEIDTQYPQLVTLQLTQDKCSLVNDILPNEMIKCYINIQGREWNGPQGVKYFNTINCWKIEKVNK